MPFGSGLVTVQSTSATLICANVPPQGVFVQNLSPTVAVTLGMGVPLGIVQAAPAVIAASLTTAAVTLAQPTGVGNSLVACVTANGNTTNPAVSGITAGGVADNWQAAVTDPGTTTFGAAIWYDPNCLPGQQSVVVTCTGGAGANPLIDVSVYEVAGVLAFDKGSHGDSSGTTWTSGTTGTITSAAEIFFGAVMVTNTGGATVTGAGTWTTQTAGTTNNPSVAGYQIVGVTGTAAYSGTIAAGSYTAVVGTFAGSGVKAGFGVTIPPAGAGDRFLVPGGLPRYSSPAAAATQDLYGIAASSTANVAYTICS